MGRESPATTVSTDTIDDPSSGSIAPRPRPEPAQHRGAPRPQPNELRPARVASPPLAPRARCAERTQAVILNPVNIGDLSRNPVVREVRTEAYPDRSEGVTYRPARLR